MSSFIFLCVFFSYQLLGAERNMDASKALSESLDFEPSPTSVYPDRNRMPSMAALPVRACTNYPKGKMLTDIFRLQLRKTTCESIPAIDVKLLDRPEADIYKVGEPFDTPKRN